MWLISRNFQIPRNRQTILNPTKGSETLDRVRNIGREFFFETAELRVSWSPCAQRKEACLPPGRPRLPDICVGKQPSWKGEEKLWLRWDWPALPKCIRKTNADCSPDQSWDTLGVWVSWPFISASPNFSQGALPELWWNRGWGWGKWRNTAHLLRNRYYGWKGPEWDPPRNPL